MQTIQHYNATQAGLLLAPGGVVMMLFSPLAGRITDTIPAHIPIAVELLDSIQRLLAAAGMPDSTQAATALDYLSQVVPAQASTLGFKDTFLAIAVVSLLAVGPAWMIGRGAKRR